VAHNNTSLLPGTLELIVLQLLQAEPTNGYDLTLRIQAVTNEVLNVNAGSPYPALYRLEQRGLLRATWAESDSGRPARRSTR
jgi:DNA-binding PadR family transcriptional regulator